VFLLLSLFLVRTYGSKVPYLDDWNLVSYITGEQPLTASWLWAQYSDHRFPLPKLILVTLLKLSGADFRAVMYVNVLALGGLALALTRAARRMRGHAAFADAFLPIAILHPGHAFGFLWAMVHTYVLPTVLVGLLLVLIVSSRGRLSPWTAGLFGLGLVLLALSGTNGLIHVPALALWLGWVGLRDRNVSGWKTSLVALGGVATALAVVGLYFIGLRHVAHSPIGYASKSVMLDYARGVLMFLAVNLGGAAYSTWRWLGPLVGTLAVVVLACLLTAVLRNRSQERARDLGLLAFLAGCLMLTLGVAWGRVGSGPQWLLVSSYAIMAEPLLFVIYFAWEAAGPECLRTVGRLLLLGLIVSLLPQEWRSGRYCANVEARDRKRLERELKVPTPVYRLTLHNPSLFPFHDQMQHHLLSLQQAGFPAYRNVMPNPAFREVPLPLVATATHEAQWEGGTGKATGSSSHVVFDLPERTRVCGIRVTARVDQETERFPFFQVQWRDRRREEFGVARSYANHMLTPGGFSQFVFYTDAWIDQIRILPDNRPCDFSISEIELLLPPDDAS
jgi:hypothetical protein